MSEEDIKTRAYYFYKDSFGNDAIHRYYMAKDMSERLQIEKCLEIEQTSICRFCHSRYGTILTPYLPNNTIICYQCYIMNSKNALIDICTDDIKSWNTHFNGPKQIKAQNHKKNENKLKSILKKDKMLTYNIEQMNKEIENNRICFTYAKKVHFGLIPIDYDSYSS
jgi:hypothetical protein